MKIERIYHPFNLWEDYEKGFYNNCSGQEKKEKIQLAVNLFCNTECLEVYMERVVKEWFYSCEHNLTNPSMNKIAYIGQAACALYASIPNTVTMEAWSLVPDEYKQKADEIAQRCINVWEDKHIETLKMRSSDNKC